MHSSGLMATVSNLTRVKILESNNVTLRPGSVYDNRTYFESIFEMPQPGFLYEFIDSGLGAAEPLYPMYQKGNQEKYLQLVPAFFNKDSRHIDHYSSLDTPEGCKVDSIYLLRAFSEYPATMFARERAEGYEMIVIKLEYYTRMRPGVQCGRHRMNDPDPNFDPMAYMKAHHDAMTLADFPAKHLGRFEAKQSAIYQIEEVMSPTWPRFDMNKLKRNSLWYYPNGHEFDYGIRSVRSHAGLKSFNLPAHTVIPATAKTREAFPLESLVKDGEYKQVLNFVSGQPTPNFDPRKEPGRDTLRLRDVTSKNFYTSGLYIEPIRDAVGDLSNPRNFKMVAMTIKPYEEQEDVAWSGARVIPQVRFVFQMMDPRRPSRPFEQFFLHLKWDATDRTADVATRRAQHQAFLERVDGLTQARNAGVAESEALLADFIREITTARPVEDIAFSSSMTGIWVFGSLSRSQNEQRALQPVRIVRNGVDVGYYSSAYDNDIFREKIKSSSGLRKANLERHMEALRVSYFRDTKRQDVHAISFNSVTCAQCHQTSARDGVHIAFNDGLDRRNRASVIATEFSFRDSDKQLRHGANFWSGK